jgi:hypothetical protein
MATIRDRVLQLHALAYTPAEIKKEMFSQGTKVTKTYILQVLALKAGESGHYRRTELIYEMLLDIQAKLDLFLGGFTERTVQRAKDRLDVRLQHRDPTKLPPTTEHGE